MKTGFLQINAYYRSIVWTLCVAVLLIVPVSANGQYESATADSTLTTTMNRDKIDTGIPEKEEIDSVALIRGYQKARRDKHAAGMELFLNSGKDMAKNVGKANAGKDAIQGSVSNIKADLSEGTGISEGVINYATMYYGGRLFIDNCCAAPPPIVFTVNKPNTRITLYTDLEQNSETGHFLIQIINTFNAIYYSKTSVNMSHCRSTDVYYYHYNCSDNITLGPGTYSISLNHSANLTNGNPSYYYSGDLEFDINEPSTGDTQTDPIVAGTFSNNFQFSNTQNTNEFTNRYVGVSSNDVFYKFTLTKKMEITMTHCGSEISDTYLTLLNASGGIFSYNDNYTGTGKCSNTSHSYLKTELQPGTYYVVSEGYGQNGVIQTNISGIIPPGDNMQNPIVAGSFNGSFQYSDSRNTSIFTHVYSGRPTNDVFYRFTLEQKMKVTMTCCGSAIDTDVHLLDASGNLIATNGDYSGDGGCSSPLHSFIQRDLDAGTYYIVSEGYSKNGIVQTNITGFINEFGYPDSPNAYSADPAAVGSLGGSFSVSGTGAATYTMPIDIPVGIGGIQPSLALTYNSQSGNGVAGRGVGISGISVITRAPKNIYHDETAKGISYLADDAYYLDGQRLILSTGAAGVEGAVYYPESDPFTKVLAHGTYSGTTCNTWFEVLTKDGRKYYYGKNANSRLTLTAGKVNSWYLDTVEDPLGNYMNYSYTYTINGYYLYLYQVTYGKNRNKTTSLENKVTLVYETRNDQIPFIIDGTKGKIVNRLKQILCYTGSTLYRSYVMEYYNVSSYSHLVSVTAKNGAGEALKPTKLDWNYYSSFSQALTSPSITAQGTAFGDYDYFSGDFNGDGITDIASIREYNSLNDCFEICYGQYVNGTLSFKSDNYISPFPKTIYTFTENPHISDFNGDGKSDLFIPVYGTVPNPNLRVMMGSGTLPDLRYTLMGGDERPLLTTGDINNNSMDDLVVLEKKQNNGKYYGRIYGYGADGTTVSSTSISLTLTGKPENIFVFDINGNGLNDLIVFYKGGYSIFWNQPTQISAYNDNSKTTGSNIGYVFMMRMGDFNGDGMLDFIMNDTDSYQWYFALNNGNGTFSKQTDYTLEICDHTFTDHDNGKFDVLVFDFDFDGKSDVVIHKAMYTREKDILGKTYGKFSSTKTHWMRSTGTTLTQVSAATSGNEYDAFSKFLFLGDFDGDGRPELMNYGHNLYNGSSTTRLWRRYKNPNLSASSGMANKITPGYGNSISITYASLPTGNFYTKGSVSTYPVMDFTPPTNAVKLVTYNNGAAGTLSESYKYAGAKAHLAGKGFLGFDKVIATNINKWEIRESGVTSYNPTWFVPAETYTKTTIGDKTAQTNIKYRFVDKGAKKYVAFPDTKTEKDMDENTVTAIYEYEDTNGNITRDSTLYGGGMYRSTRYSDYVQAGGTMPNKPKLVTVAQKHAEDDNPFVSRTTFVYNETRGLVKKQTQDKVTLSFSYDTCGNVLKETTDTLGNLVGTRKYEYDPTLRFVVKVSAVPAAGVTTYKHDLWGNMEEEKDETNPDNVLTTVHTYDGWGQRTSTTLPGNRKTEYITGWNNKAEKCYFSLTQGKGQPWVKTWYDEAGREVEVETVGPGGMSIKAKNTFNSNGELTRTESTTGSLTTWKGYTYDDRGRTLTQSDSRGQSVSYNYGNRSVTATMQDPAGSKVTTRTYDAWGGLQTVTDPGGSVSYDYKSTGSPASITGANATFTMKYDNIGNQVELVDPNAGTFTYKYDALGRIVRQKDGSGNVQTTKYDALGRVEFTTLGTLRTDYIYGTKGNDKLMLTKVKTGANQVRYTYDALGRQLTETRTIEGADSLVFSYGYDPEDRWQTVTYPGQVITKQEYDVFGNLVKVSAGSQTVWEQGTLSGTTSTALIAGGSMTATSEYNTLGMLTGLKTTKGTTQVRNMGFVFDGASGNLSSRTGMVDVAEHFKYDPAGRLIRVEHGDQYTEAMVIDYYANGSGNILNKTGIGKYDYKASKPHAVEFVDNTDGLISHNGQTVTYTAFHKASRIKETTGANAYQLDIVYGPGQQRWKSELRKNNGLVKTIIFAGDYEKVTENGVTQELYYIGGGDGLAAVYVKQAGQTDRLYYAHTDHLGSIVSLTDANGSPVFRATYDAWGRQALHASNTFKFHRGYTGHEHLNEFGLINMNGRMYDPLLGRFLSPDPYIQAPKFSQSFNRYSYCLNNPFLYSDPSGYWWGVDDAIVAGVGFVVGYLSHGFSNNDWGSKAFAAGGISAISSWLMYNTAGAASNFLTDTGLGENASTLIGNGIGTGVGSFSGNIIGQAYYSHSIDLGQAGQAALYGFGYGIGSGFVDLTSITKQFPMHHTVKYMARSLAGEITGNLFSGFYGEMTLGLNPGIIFPLISDGMSLTSRFWTSKIAQKKLDEMFNSARESDVDLYSDIKLRAKIDYGSYTEDSGHWVAGSNEGNFIYDDVGLSLQLKVVDGGFSINKIGNTAIKGLQVLNLKGLAFDFPLYKLPFTHTSAIHFASSYSISHRLWKGRR